MVVEAERVGSGEAGDVVDIPPATQPPVSPKKTLKRLKRRSGRDATIEKKKENLSLAPLALGEGKEGATTPEDQDKDKEKAAASDLTLAPVAEVARPREGTTKSGGDTDVKDAEDLVEEFAAWDDEDEEPEELVEFLELEKAGEASQASLSRSEEPQKSDGARSELSNPPSDDAAAAGEVESEGPEEPAFDTEHDANVQRDLIADAERERIGKGFNPEVKPMSSILEKIDSRKREAALRKPTAPDLEAPQEEAGLNFADFADKIMSIKPETLAGAISIEQKPEEAGLEGEAADPTASQEEGEDMVVEEEEEENEEEVKRNTNEIRLAVKEPEPEPEAEEEVELEEEESEEYSEEYSEESSEEEEEEEEEGGQANGFTWEEDEPLPDELAEEEDRAAAEAGKENGEQKPLASKKKLPKVNRGFVELEAELSDDEGHLHDDEHEEIDDEDDSGADLEDLIDRRRYRETEGEGKRRNKFHQNWMEEKEDEDLEKFINAVETGFRKKRKGIAGEDDEGNDRDARKRRAELADLGDDYDNLERIFDAKMLKEEDLCDGEVEMIEQAYKRRNQRMAEKRQREMERAGAQALEKENLISNEAIASIIPREASLEPAVDMRAKKMFIQRDTVVMRSGEGDNATAVAKTSFLSVDRSVQYNKGKGATTKRNTFVFAKKKPASQASTGDKGKIGGGRETSKMPEKVDNLLRSSSLAKLLRTTSQKNPTHTFNTQAALDLSRIIKM